MILLVPCTIQIIARALMSILLEPNAELGLYNLCLKKTQKFGVKVWTLCESTSGYFIQFQIYTGESPDSAKRGLLRRVFF